MIDKIIFGTTNEGKLSEARNILEIEVEGLALEVDEIQSLDGKEVAIKKAKEYFAKAKRPLFIEDVSLEFNALNSLPGVFIDYFMKAFGNEGVVDLMRGKNNRSARAITTLVYIWGSEEYQVFEGVTTGTISKKPKGEGFGWDPIFIPNGEKRTFGEMKVEEKNKYSMRAKALKKMKKWLLSRHQSN